MEITEVEMKKLLPAWMRDDEANIGLSLGCDEIAKDFYGESRLLSKWNKIDELPEEILDELAYDLNIPWYVSTADIAAKRKIIKNSILVHSHLGTVDAVNMVIQDYFESGEVEEWFEYDGKPYFFRISSHNAALVMENYKLFIQLMNIVKRESAWLDHIAIKMEGDATVYAGTAIHDKSHETVRIVTLSEPGNYVLTTGDDELLTDGSGADLLTAYAE